MASSRIVVLASSLESKAKLIDEHFRKIGLPSPSFDASTPPMLPLPSDITQLKEEVLEASEELQELLRGPMPQSSHVMTETVGLTFANYPFHRTYLSSH
jgi:hypothetical protein